MHWNLLQNTCTIVPEEPKEILEPIILDSGSTFSLYKNTDHIIPGSERQAPQDFTYGTNTGTRTLTVNCKSRHFEGKKMLDRAAIATLESVSELVRQGYKMFMDTDVENAYKISKGNKNGPS